MKYNFSESHKKNLKKQLNAQKVARFAHGKWTIEMKIPFDKCTFKQKELINILRYRYLFKFVDAIL